MSPASPRDGGGGSDAEEAPAPTRRPTTTDGAGEPPPPPPPPRRSLSIHTAARHGGPHPARRAPTPRWATAEPAPDGDEAGTPTSVVAEGGEDSPPAALPPQRTPLPPQRTPLLGGGPRARTPRLRLSSCGEAAPRRSAPTTPSKHWAPALAAAGPPGSPIVAGDGGGAVTAFGGLSRRRFSSVGSGWEADDVLGRLPSLPAPTTPTPRTRARASRPPWLAATAVLGPEIASNLAYYSISVNLVVYLSVGLGRSPGAAAAQAHTWTGLAYLTPLLGGAFADGVAGRPLTVLAAAAVQAAGLGLLTLQAGLLAPATPGGPPPRGADIVFGAAMVALACATGGIKPNVSPCGADQFDDDDDPAHHRPPPSPSTTSHGDDDALDAREASKASFFNWYYFAINVGALASSAGLVYLQTAVSWPAGFGVPAGAALLAALIYGGAFAKGWIVDGASSGEATARGRSSGLARLGRAAGRRLRRLRRRPAAIAPAADEEKGGAPPLRAPDPASLHEDADARQLLRLLPTWLSLLGWNVAYATASTVMVQQGGLMDCSVGRGGRFTVPPASLFLAATVTLLAAIPAYERLALPLLRSRGRAPTPLQRIGAACGAITVAMAAATGVEAARRARAQRMPAGSPSLSILWLIPQYAAVGVAECFYVAAVEFFYSQSPPGLRSLSAAALLAAFGFANLISGGLVSAASRWGGWMPAAAPGAGEGGPSEDDAAHAWAAGGWRLDAYFGAMTAFSALNTLVFVCVVAKRYAYWSPSVAGGEAGDAVDGGAEAAVAGSPLPPLPPPLPPRALSRAASVASWATASATSSPRLPPGAVGGLPHGLGVPASRRRSSGAGGSLSWRGSSAGGSPAASLHGGEARWWRVPRLSFGDGRAGLPQARSTVHGGEGALAALRGGSGRPPALPWRGGGTPGSGGAARPRSRTATTTARLARAESAPVLHEG